jgi:hypothetical protein
LASVFEEILIPLGVYAEVVVKVKERGHSDSVLVVELIDKGHYHS